MVVFSVVDNGAALISLRNHPQVYSAEIQPFDLYFNFGEDQNHNEL